MTFNRYITFRMAMELIGALSCATQLFRSRTLIGIVVTGLIALIWIIGEVWVVTILNRENPRTDELSDSHQLAAFRFSFMVTMVALLVIGFVTMMAALILRRDIAVTPMLLPTLAMLALALADGRYLWLEHSTAVGDDDED